MGTKDPLEHVQVTLFVAAAKFYLVTLNLNSTPGDPLLSNQLEIAHFLTIKARLQATPVQTNSP